MQNRFKPILPAPVAPRPAAEGSPSPIAGTSTTLRQRRSAVRVACNGCRAKRTACDGNRPTCNQCFKRGSPCVYVSASSTETPIMAMKREMECLKKNHNKLTETFDMLRSVPEDVSVSMLQRLRSVSVTDPAGVLSVVRGDGAAPDQAGVPRQVMARPPPQDGPEFELMLRHAWAYPALMPLDAAAVSMTAFTVPGPSPRPTPVLAPDPLSTPSSQPASLQASPSPVYQPSSSSSSSAAASGQAPNPAAPDPAMSTTNTLPFEYMEYCDERLNLLQISAWIGTDMSNSVAASLLSLYLKTDHPVLGMFDSDLFLDDLIARRTRFCSPLLVCSMLVWASHMYSTVVPGLASDAVEMLLSEALAFWKYEHSLDSLPTIAAAQFLGLNCIYSGEDAGLPYLGVGSDMAQRLGLFGPHRTRFPIRGEHESGMEEDGWAQAAAHTAWGVYNCLAMHAFMLQRYEPALDFPPLLDVPGAFSHTAGDEHLTDGALSAGLPDYMGRTFPATCSFWVLTSQWMSTYYPPFHSPVPGRVSWFFAESVFEKLLAWSDKLHFRLARGDQATHHGTILHVWFHASVLEIFRPFASQFSGYVPSALAYGDSAMAEANFMASIHQLKHLIMVFRYTFPCAPYVVYWHMALLQVANAALEDTSDPQWRDYFALCVNCYADLVGPFPVAEGIVRSLLSMGLRDGTISALEAQSYLHSVRSRRVPHAHVASTSSTIVVDLKLAVTDRNAAQLKAMADLFDSLTLFDQFINPGTEGVESFQPVEGSSLGGRG